MDDQVTDAPPSTQLRALPSNRLHNLRLGTSSWAYEGWRGIVYHRPYPRHRFSQDCLAEYAAYRPAGRPLFRTVCIDHTFYRPGDGDQFAHYAAQVPEDFHFCSKVWEEVTVPAYATLPRYGARAGRPNARFLDPALCAEEVIHPTRAALGHKTGPFIFEFQRYGLEPEAFFTGLDRLFAALPKEVPYAVEVRDARLLGPRYRDLLRAHGVAHIYNHWNAMPPLARQHELLGRAFTASFAVVRLLTPLGLAHAEAVKRYAPYDRLVQPLPRMREDAAALVRQALAEDRSIYVLANNRAEGHAPLTLQAILDRLAAGSDDLQEARPV